MNKRELWKSGIPLSKAWFQFSSEELYRKYNRPKLSRIISPQTGVGMIIDALSNHPDGPRLKRSLVRTQHEIEFRGHRSNIQREMEFDVLEKLQVGTLVAYGYLAGRNIRAAPLGVPERFLEAKFIKWDSDSILAPPHEFTSVRVIRAPSNNQIHRPNAPREKSKTRGRPSVRNDIIEAMMSLAAVQPNIIFSPQKKWAPKIRERVHDLFPNKFGPYQPADRTIMRIIPDGWKAINSAKNSDT